MSYNLFEKVRFYNRSGPNKISFTNDKEKKFMTDNYAPGGRKEHSVQSVVFYDLPFDEAQGPKEMVDIIEIDLRTNHFTQDKK